MCMTIAIKEGLNCTYKMSHCVWFNHGKYMYPTPADKQQEVESSNLLRLKDYLIQLAINVIKSTHDA